MKATGTLALIIKSNNKLLCLAESLSWAYKFVNTAKLWRRIRIGRVPVMAQSSWHDSAARKYRTFDQTNRLRPAPGAPRFFLTDRDRLHSINRLGEVFSKDGETYAAVVF